MRVRTWLEGSARFSILLLLFALSCTFRHSLSSEEMNKLDFTLQRFVLGEFVGEDELPATIRLDGSKEYGVIVRTSNVDELTKAGFRPNSVFGDVVTVRVTVDELRRLVKLSSVRFVEAGSKNYPQPK